ncbi:hypothetical protein [Streptomyces sp. NBC_01465]|uniref:hypothetical protein n=1 Tax=Streptomyces sp. NBC_01465 TaxID=2903878 RepID=UPI002E351A9D|nr:hypothetical protein [Streptomyces sp. NBC_01465]
MSLEPVSVLADGVELGDWSWEESSAVELESELELELELEELSSVELELEELSSVLDALSLLGVELGVEPVSVPLPVVSAASACIVPTSAATAAVPASAVAAVTAAIRRLPLLTRPVITLPSERQGLSLHALRWALQMRAG